MSAPMWVIAVCSYQLLIVSEKYLRRTDCWTPLPCRSCWAAARSTPTARWETEGEILLSGLTFPTPRTRTSSPPAASTASSGASTGAPTRRWTWNKLNLNKTVSWNIFFYGIFYNLNICLFLNVWSGPSRLQYPSSGGGDDMFWWRGVCHGPLSSRNLLLRVMCHGSLSSRKLLLRAMWHSTYSCDLYFEE